MLVSLGLGAERTAVLAGRRVRFQIRLLGDGELFPRGKLDLRRRVQRWARLLLRERRLAHGAALDQAVVGAQARA